jgi:hypothetical protein
MKKIKSLALIFVFPLLGHAALEGLVDEPFAGTSLDAAWSKYLNAPMSVSDGSITMTPPGVVGMQRAYITRNTDDAGNTTVDSGAQVFNPYDHELTMAVELGTLEGMSVSGQISYFIGVSKDVNLNSLTPSTADDGIFFQIVKYYTGEWQLRTHLRANDTATAAAVGSLSGAPTAIEIGLNGNDWAVELTGATFTNGSFSGTSLATGSFTAIAESDFDDTFHFSVGCENQGAASVQASMEILNVEISMTVAELIRDLYDGTSLDAQWSKHLNSAITVSNSMVLMDNVALNTGHRAYIARNTDGNGSETNNGVEVFNFFDHPVSIGLDGLTIAGLPESGKRASYFVGVSYNAAGLQNLTPTYADDGAFLAVEMLDNSSYRIMATECVGGGASAVYVGALSGAPSDLKLKLSGTNWVLSFTGATFTDQAFNGKSMATGSFNNISEADFEDQFYLSVGCVHIGPQLTAASMGIDSVLVTTPLIDESEHPYDTWIAEYALSGPNAGMTADPDGDGWNNLLEYALGGNPTNPVVSGYGASADLQSAGGTNWFEYVHLERIDKEDRGLSYTPEQAAALSDTNWTASGFFPAGSGAYNADFNTVTNRVEINGQNARFIRLKIEQQ